MRRMLLASLGLAAVTGCKTAPDAGTEAKSLDDVTGTMHGSRC